jgi:hypothetical protein
LGAHGDLSWAGRKEVGSNRIAITAPESVRKSLGKFAPQKRGRTASPTISVWFEPTGAKLRNVSMKNFGDRPEFAKGMESPPLATEA